MGGVVVAVDARNYPRGGRGGVEVSYQLPLDSLPLIGWGTLELRHQAVEPIDLFRSLS